MTGRKVSGPPIGRTERRVDALRAVTVCIAGRGQREVVLIKHWGGTSFSFSLLKVPINGQRRTAVDEAADEAENEHCFADEDENEDKSGPRFEVAERRPAQQNAHRRGHKGGGAGY